MGHTYTHMLLACTRCFTPQHEEPLLLHDPDTATHLWWIDTVHTTRLLWWLVHTIAAPGSATFMHAHTRGVLRHAQVWDQGGLLGVGGGEGVWQLVQGRASSQPHQPRWVLRGQLLARMGVVSWPGLQELGPGCGRLLLAFS
jgi:hypothetical protein